jgi:secreted trypsin-like serine protease
MIALIRVLYGFSLGNNVAAIPYGTKVPSSGPGFVAGWGLTTEGGDLSNTLLWTEIPFVAFSQCNNAFGGDLDSKIQVCAGGVVGHDTCQGDSGGPLFTATDPANPTDAALIGLTSFGRGCGGDTPGVYTNVPDFGTTWLTQKFSSVACRTQCVTEFRLCKAATTGNRRCRQLKNRCYLYCLPLPRPTISS